MQGARKGRPEVVVVTGSSAGIGRAIALRMAQEGYAVVVNYHTSADAAATSQPCVGRESASRRDASMRAGFASRQVPRRWSGVVCGM